MKEIKSYRCSDDEEFSDYGDAIEHEYALFMTTIRAQNPSVQDLLDHFRSQGKADHGAQVLNLTKAYFVDKGLTVGWCNHYNF